MSWRLERTREEWAKWKEVMRDSVNKRNWLNPIDWSHFFLFVFSTFNELIGVEAKSIEDAEKEVGAGKRVVRYFYHSGRNI